VEKARLKAKYKRIMSEGREVAIVSNKKVEKQDVILIEEGKRKMRRNKMLALRPNIERL
jgi:hypothetical protein